MSDPRDVILRPVVSEKSYGLLDRGVYTFVVAPGSNKVEIRHAVEVIFGAYGTMQRKILETEMRNVYFQAIGKRAFLGLTPQELVRATRADPTLAKLMNTVPATDLRYIRPQQVLPLGVVGFNDWAGIDKAYRVGWEDVGRGFTPYDWETFEL